MDSRNEKKNLNNLTNNYIGSHRNFQEIPAFYSTFDSFMKQKVKNQIMNKNRHQNDGINFSKLMNSLHEYNKKKSNIELKMIKDKDKDNDKTKKKEKLFKLISLRNFNDNISKKKHNIFIKKQNTSSSYLITKRDYLKQRDEKENSHYASDVENFNFNFNNEMKNYENLERIILKLIDTVRKPKDFILNCNEWVDKFENIIKDKDSIIKVKNGNDIDEKEKSINLLIISIIAAFMRLKLYELNDNCNKENIIKDLSEIMIIHHKIFLLLCYDLLLENIYLNNSNKYGILDYNNINLFLFEQIKAYLPKKIYINNANNQYIILEKEIQSCNTLFYSMLKSILLDLEKEDKNVEINYLQLKEIFSFKTTKLIDLFKKIYQTKKEKVNNLNSPNVEEPIRSIFNYRNKKLIKKQYIIDNNNDLYKTTNNNSSISNFFKNSRIIGSYKNLEYKNNDNYNSSNLIRNIPDNEKARAKENIYIQNKNKILINSSSCKIIPSSASFLINAHQKENNNNNSNNNIKIKNNIPFNKVTKINISRMLLNRPCTRKPNPPYLTQNIQYSKFNKKIFTLILDLDETLIKFQVGKNSFEKGKIIFRPGLFQFLNKVFPLFDLILWTVATKDYADNVINNIENEKKFFSARLYRDHATYKNKIYIKDLSNLGRPLDKIIIIDDKENSFSLQRNNGILIRPFHGTKWECQNDYVLMDLYNILTKIIFDRSQDVRIGINKYKKEILKKISYINNSDNAENYNSEN